MRRFVLLGVCVVSALALGASYGLQTATASPPPNVVCDPETCGGGGSCNTINTSTGTSNGNQLLTSVTWCYNGTNVTYVDASTTYYVNNSPWYFGGWGRYTAGTLNTPNWDLYRTGAFYHGTGPTEPVECLQNIVHLHGNGTYSTNPGSYTHTGSVAPEAACPN